MQLPTRPLLKLLSILLVYLVTLAAVVAVTFALVLLLAGPHTGLLPAWLEAVILALGWLVVLFLPIYISWKIWRRSDKKIQLQPLK